MGKFKSSTAQQTGGSLTGRKKTCFDCVHVLPGPNGHEVTCEVYTFKYERYRVPRKGTVAPLYANGCSFYTAMTPKEKTASAQKFREFYRRMG